MAVTLSDQTSKTSTLAALRAVLNVLLSGKAFPLQSSQVSQANLAEKASG